MGVEFFLLTKKISPTYVQLISSSEFDFSDTKHFFGAKKSVEAAEKNNITYEAYSLYGSEPFSAKVFIDRGFVWDTYSEIIIIENIQAKKLIRYAYVLFTNQTVRLWKL